MHQPTQKGAGRNHDCSARKLDIQIGAATNHFAPLKNQARNSRLKHLEIRLELQRMLEAKLISFLVTLSPRGLDCRPLGFIQQPELDSGDIGIDRHLAAKGIDLTHDLPFCLATDSRVAAHLCNCINITRKQQGGCSRASSGETCLHARVSSTANNYIERGLVKNHGFLERIDLF
jgi:hypothetical protein